MAVRALTRVATLLLLTTPLAACVVAPRVTTPPPFPLALGGVHVTVNRDELRTAVVDGLRNAGIPESETPADLHYMLRARIGSARGVSGDCGTIRSVRYTLHYAVLPQARAQRTELRARPGGMWTMQSAGVGALAIQMVARGPVGDCPSNVFAEMGAALRSHMTGKLQIIDPADRFHEEDPRVHKSRRSWVHTTHASDSDVFYANLRECMKESEQASAQTGSANYLDERFDVCMKSLGWRPE